MKGASLSEGRSWSDTPLCVANKVAVFTWAGQRGCQLQGGLMSGRLIGYQGNQQRGTLLTVPLDIMVAKVRRVISWFLRQVCSKIGQLNRAWVMQALVKQEAQRTAILGGLTIQCLFKFHPFKSLVCPLTFAACN